MFKNSTPKANFDPITLSSMETTKKHNSHIDRLFSSIVKT